jgi:hypothetical protein
MALVGYYEITMTYLRDGELKYMCIVIRNISMTKTPLWLYFLTCFLFITKQDLIILIC